MDIFANDLTLYFEFDRHRKRRNKENIRKALNIIHEFYEWCGLKINIIKQHGQRQSG